MRGAYPEASDDQKTEYAEIEAWLERCGEEGKARLEAEMAALGVILVEGQFAGAANLCGQVVTRKGMKSIENYSDLEEGLPGARLVFNTLVSNFERVEENSGPFSNDETSFKIHALTHADQLLRNAFTWGWNEQTGVRTPSMSAKEREVFLALLNAETLRIDHRNTEWLKRYVGEHGWPTISKVGKRGARAAWLLTQHADMDPAFQLRMLRLMEPLVAEGDVSKSSFAYLYDRIMLKLSGKQRYATQVTCENGERVPLPLEEPERVDELRAEMELGPFAEYLKRFGAGC